ncbi:MAG: protein kinase, partial [Actinobacteria bacterium]|nr:protein kinase [Actinomycetota bacterium]
EQIGRGGMGEIFVAEDKTLGRKVAVKLLSERFARDENIRRRFTREALAAARLSGHPHIVTIFDVGEAGSRPFIVMEHMSGGTLADRARTGRVDKDQAIEWLRQAGDALDEAHERGIVHRDVKPANLLLDERGEIHVCDFGIARIVDETQTGMTMAGTVLGTAGYLSPEQARGDPATSASDIYSLGIVAYELLTGGRPFEGGSATAEAAAHIHQPVPPASERGVGLPREVDPVFERVLAKDPERRYLTARDFVRALCLALEVDEQTLPAEATQRIATARTAPTRVVSRRSRSWIPIAAAVGLAAIALTGVILAAVVAGGNDRSAERENRPKVVTKEVTTVIEAEGTTVRQIVTVKATPTSSVPVVPATPSKDKSISFNEAVELTDQATFAMRDGRYDDALVLAERALSRLRGTGHIYEAYAYYDAGNSLAELGQCEKALTYLDRSEDIQGQRKEIDKGREKCS